MNPVYKSLLIDGDRLASFFSTQGEGEVRTPAVHNVHALEEKAIMELTQKISEWTACFQTQLVEIALSDTAHFRRRMFSDYQAYGQIAIQDSRLYQALFQYLKRNYPCLRYPGLESIDVLGVWATSPYIMNEPRLMISTNPNLAMIPGDGWNPKLSDSKPVSTSRYLADLEFFRQALCGRPADNFEGCPGIDSEKAQELLTPFREAVEDYRTQNDFWKAGIWKMIEDNYIRAGKTKEDALFCARLARICRYTDYDWIKKAPILWSSADGERKTF